MSTGKEQLDVEEDFTAVEAEDAEPVVEVAKTNLSKRRTSNWPITILTYDT